MKKLALNFICKNESHVILKMLESVRNITDMIVAVDTGSKDKTIQLIQQFGIQYSIPTFIYERPFDDFCNSRNYALQKLNEAVQELKWNKEQIWGYFIDCDEVMTITNDFQKEELTQDFYYITVEAEGELFLRRSFFHLSKNCWWEGPIHEMIVWDDPNVSRGIIKGISISAKPNGASWKDNLEQKFLNYAEKLVNYVRNGHQQMRWTFYIGESYSAAAHYSKSKKRKKKWLIIAKQYYEKAITLEARNDDEKVLTHFKLAQAKEIVGDAWPEVEQTYLKMYALDCRRAESIVAIIKHHLSAGNREIAYLYSTFAKDTFHSKSPFGYKASWTDDSLYRWKVLFLYYLSCYDSGRKTEALLVYEQLKQLIISNCEYFNKKDLLYIQVNSPVMLGARNRIIKFRKKINHLITLNFLMPTLVDVG